MYLEQREQSVVVTVGSNETHWYGGFRPVSAKKTEKDAWQRLSAGEGQKGPRLYDWARAPLLRKAEPQWEH